MIKPYKKSLSLFSSFSFYPLGKKGSTYHVFALDEMHVYTVKSRVLLPCNNRTHALQYFRDARLKTALLKQMQQKVTWKWKTTNKLREYEFKVPVLESLILCALAHSFTCTKRRKSTNWVTLFKGSLIVSVMSAYQ